MNLVPFEMQLLQRMRGEQKWDRCQPTLPVCPQDAVFDVVEREDVAADAVRSVGEELVP